MEDPWNIIDKYFRDNPHNLVKHQLSSYDDFLNNGIQQIFREKNPIKIMKQQDPDTKEFGLQCNLYLGGKDGDLLYYGKPVIYDDEKAHFMYPNEARLRNMTYGITIHYDVVVDFKMKGETGEFLEHTLTLDQIFLGRFPIMLQSKYCVLNTLTPQIRFNMGECKNDRGGYFIIDGKEKAMICQEKFADNMLYVKDSVNDIYSHAAEIRSVSEDASKPIRTMSIRIVAPTPSSSNNQIVVNVPNVRKPVPLFILMRALGIESDKKIIEFCLLDLEKNKDYIDLFIPSIHDAGRVFNQDVALKYIATFTKGKTVPHVLEILMNYFLPNVGELNFEQKAYFVGYMVYNLLMVFTKNQPPTDRDSFKYKRVEVPGTLLYDLFKEYYTLQQRNIYLKIDKEYYYHVDQYQKNFVSLIENNYREFFKERIVETGMKRGFKGDWGSEAHTKKPGVVQDLNRLSFNSAISHLRKINLPLEASAKIVKPHLLHNSQWGIIDPVDTPDGGNVGLHKHMAIATQITNNCSGTPMINWMRINTGMKLLEECSTKYISQCTKIFVNGSWVGVLDNPEFVMKKIKFFRHLALLPVYLSCHWNMTSNEILIYTDAGRLTRPIFYMNGVNPSYAPFEKIIKDRDFTWNELITGFLKKADERFQVDGCKIYEPEELYPGIKEEDLIAKKAIIEFIDSAEEESALIAMNADNLGSKPFTHMEIHPSLIFGVMGNQIVFPENNQLPRDLFSCGQSKQAVSLYHSNYQTRIDKMGVVLNCGQIPLVKSRYLQYINEEQHPYGMNAIVAIMCYGGYNVEDAILFNEGSIKRGMFRTTYFNMYESREESSKVAGNTVDSHFTNIESEETVGLRPGYDYSALNKYGLIKENTPLDDKKVVIGRVTTNLSDVSKSLDSSVFPKKGQLGFVDKSFITEGEEGFRLAKVRIREERVPAIGDKFCSRCGQKGTIGMIIPEEDMPFTAEGVKPDLIVNPHALPSRMTIGQLVETLMGKACVMYGSFGDCTAFSNKGPKHEIFGQLLTNIGYNSTGNELLYNGQTGHQMETQIFMGPTYYMRLKHMVKDKINYRAQGPRTVLTRQTVQGRANDGGLRIGEMERDGIIAHGAAKFLEESLMVRGDEYYMAVCNKSGTIAIYNETLNLFLSPMADGPIKFNESLEGTMNIENVSKFGRSFSIVRIPYALKLLMQELLTMNIQMRIITEDNVDQLTNLSFSDNASKLMSISNITTQQIIERNREALIDSKQDNQTARVPNVPDLGESSQEQNDYKSMPPPSESAPLNQPTPATKVPFDDPFDVPFDDPFDDNPDPSKGNPQQQQQSSFFPVAPPQVDSSDSPPSSTTPNYAVTSPSYSQAPATSPQQQSSPVAMPAVSMPAAVMMPVVPTMPMMAVPQQTNPQVTAAVASPTTQALPTQRTPAEEEMRLKEVLSSNEGEDEKEEKEEKDDNPFADGKKIVIKKL